MQSRRKNVLDARRPGQGLVEFALVISLLMLLLLGVVEFARAWNLHQVMTDAAREGARNAVVGTTAPPTSDIYAVVNSALARAQFDSTVETTTITPDPISNTTGTPITVDITYPFEMRLIRGLLRWTTGQSQFTLRTSATMRKE
jgi:Flp pilus assembly protein TadG